MGDNDAARDAFLELLSRFCDLSANGVLGAVSYAIGFVPVLVRTFCLLGGGGFACVIILLVCYARTTSRALVTAMLAASHTTRKPGTPTTADEASVATAFEHSSRGQAPPRVMRSVQPPMFPH